MEAKNAPFETRDDCPWCGKDTSVVKLGSEPAREVCFLWGCNWDGQTLE